MQYYIYTKENIFSLPKRNFKTAVHVLLIAIVVSTAAAVFHLIPVVYCFIAALCCTFLAMVCSFIYSRYASLFKKKILLQVGEDSLKYYSVERDEMVEVPASEIVKINTKFCELQIHTRDQYVHRISISSVKKEQTRWEIKECVKQLAS